MPENTPRTRRDMGRYVNDRLRDRYFAACDVLYAKGAPIRSETDVETSFGTTHVYRYGPADPAAESRTPVVLIHGSGGCSAMWYPNTAALSADRPVYALDTPGDPGRSIHREPMWQPERAAQWMTEAFDALGLDKVHLVGSSYGGWLVINQAHRQPERLASVTALDPGGLEKVGFRFFVWIFASLFATFAPERLRPALAKWLEQPVISDADLRAWIQAGVKAFRIRRPAPLPLSDAELGSIRTPFYLIMGKRSLLVHPKRQLERVPRVIPGARAEIVAATGHGPQIDHPDLVNARMLSFMEDIDSLPPTTPRDVTDA
ncbi:alpha/beta fold hydrolase [Streptomyces pristinaespiralis]|uniref:Carboxylesterase n=2 Tax=Streptomyces pristinaespiralis TaxID=38300 RepID=B5HCI1_STRE2|nr:alpha/beta fold hydrolase [Streptomyces pristinaespiralis]ALC20117.1 alpha/beta hydrolase [Streptomyces pristinaespiralis]EDY64542.1 carboxylesterase [Streptomyces pristinaespiralis ATCC 25486]